MLYNLSITYINIVVILKFKYKYTLWGVKKKELNKDIRRYS